MQAIMLAAHQQGEDKLLGGVGDEDGDRVDDNEDRLNEDPNLRHKKHIKEPPTSNRVDYSLETSCTFVLSFSTDFVLLTSSTRATRGRLCHTSRKLMNGFWFCGSGNK